MTPPTCPSGKMPYPAPKWAAWMARDYNRRHKKRARLYLCAECGWYHIGRGRVKIKTKRKVIYDNDM